MSGEHFLFGAADIITRMPRGEAGFRRWLCLPCFAVGRAHVVVATALPRPRSPGLLLEATRSLPHCPRGSGVISAVTAHRGMG